jgi:hypothetical protein
MPHARPAAAAILAFPETTASVVYGMYDLFAPCGGRWRSRRETYDSLDNSCCQHILAPWRSESDSSSGGSPASPTRRW